jgi:iron complex outermembrane receptor protein
MQQHFKLIRLFTSVLIWGSLTSGLFAQQQPAPLDTTLTDTLETIQIEAAKFQYSVDRAPFSYSMVEKSTAELNRSADINLANLAKQLPGIWINDRENYALGERITMRGIGWRSAFGVRGIQLVLDGIPLTMADGQSVTNIIDPGYIRRLEIIRGPSSLFWGNAGGGVLYMQTIPRDKQNSSISIGAQTGSYNTKRYELQVSQPLGKHYISGYASRQLSDGYRDYSSSELNRAGLGGYFQLGSKILLKYHGAFLSMPFAEHPGSLTREQAQNEPTQALSSYRDTESGKSVTQAQAGVALHWTPKFGSFELSGFGIRRDLENPLPFAVIDVQRNAAGGRFAYENSFSNLSVQVGAESKYQGDYRQNFDNNLGEVGTIPLIQQTEEVWSRSGFGILSYNWRFLDLTGGIRYNMIRFTLEDDILENGDDSGERNFDALTPAVGLGAALGKQYFYANYTTAYEAPTTTELVNRPDSQGGFNPNIEPEHMEGIEVGVRGSFWKQQIRYDLVAFRQTIDDMLIPYQVPQSDRVYYQNAASTQHQGLELNLEVQPIRSLVLGTSLSYLEATFLKGQTPDGTISLDDNKIPGVSPFRVNGYLQADLNDVQIKVSFEHVDSYYVNSINTERNNQYNLIDLHLAHLGITLNDYVTMYPFLEIRNLMDINYYGSVTVNARGDRFFEPSAGRHAMAGFTIEVD